MSVLNKMLRDLEQRQTGPAAAAVAIPVSGRRSNTVLVILVLCGLLLLVAYFIQPAAKVSESLKSSLTSAVVPPAETSLANESIISGPHNSGHSEHEQKVLVEAKAATLESDIVSAVIDADQISEAHHTEVIKQADLTPAPATELRQERETTSPGSLAVARSQPTTEQQVEALTQQAVATTQAGQLKQALQLWQQVQQLQPTLVTAYLAQARLWLQLGQPMQAELIIRQGLQQGIVDAQLQFLLAQQAASKAEWQQVDTLLPAKFELAQHPEYYGLKATALQQLGQQQASLHWYQQLLQLQPQQARWWLGAALAYDNLQQRENAQLHYRQALQWGETLSAASQQFIQQRLAATE